RARKLADEQAALRRVATLVGRGVPPSEVFASVAEEVGVVLGVDVVNMVRHEHDETVTVVASWSRVGGTIPIGSQLPLAGPSIMGTVARTGRPARIDSYGDVPGATTYIVEGVAIQAGVGVPIAVGGRVWGTMLALSADPTPLPGQTEARLSDFTELVATAIANADADARLRRLADEQAALRRVATLVGRGVPPSEVFASVAEEVGVVLGVDVVNMVRHERDETVTVVASWSRGGGTSPVGSQLPLAGPSIMGTVARTRRPARIDSYGDVPGATTYIVEGVAIQAGVGVPIVVGGRVWGTMLALSADPTPLPGQTEARLSDFTELVATAIANADADARLRRLADEPAGLRRVAPPGGRGVPPSEVFASVAEEVGVVLGVDVVNMVRHERDETVTVVASWSRVGGTIPVGSQLPLAGPSIMGSVARTGRPARIDSYGDVPGATTYIVKGVAIQAGVGVPIAVGGRVWGTMLALSADPTPLPGQTEARLSDFTELVATAIANADADARLRRLADEQAALRRVATLVGRGVPPSEVFASVAEEVGVVLGVDVVNMVRHEHDETVTVV